MLKLGHIVYSNCFPPHAGIILKRTAFPFTLVEGIPTELNRLLHEGSVDVSPSSSIEYAMNPGRYLLFPDLSITSKKKVMSILLESKVPIEGLDRKVVALTTASATSVVLLRIMLEKSYNLHPRYVPYVQGEEDPMNKADAMLTIGDLAIKRSITGKYPYSYDLGALWQEFTGFPFVFALWQVNDRRDIHSDLSRLYDIIIESRAYGLSHLDDLAKTGVERFGLPSDVLHDYWSLFSYHFSEYEQKGLLAYYAYAAEIGAIQAAPDLRFWSKD